MALFGPYPVNRVHWQVSCEEGRMAMSVNLPLRIVTEKSKSDYVLMTWSKFLAER